MGSGNFIQTNFTTGEISSKMEGRVDLDRYYNAVKTLRNWLPMVQGGVTRRPGLRFVDYTKYADKETILIPFEYGVTDAYMIECGDYYMRFIKDGYLIRSVSGSELVTNGTFVADITGWTDHSVAPGTAVWDGVGAASLNGGSTGVGSLGQSITTVSGKTYLLTFDVVTAGLTLRIGTTEHGTEILNDVSAPVGTTITVTFIARGVTTYIQFLKQTNGESKFDNVTCKLYDPVEIVSPYAEADLMHVKWAQDSNNLYLVHPDYWPRLLTRTSDTAWTITTLDTSQFIDGPYFAEDDSLTLTPSNKKGGGDIVGNGGFNSTADWTLGAEWSISGGKALKAAGGVSTLSQARAGGFGEIYLFTFTIDSISGGSITPQVGTIDGTARSTPGTFSEYITSGIANANIVFTPSDAGVVCQIDNVSVIRVIIITASADIFVAGQEQSFWRIKQGTASDPTTWVWGAMKMIEITDARHAYMQVLYSLSATGVRDADLKDTTASLGYREGRWSTLRGWPRCVTFHQNRLVFGGTLTSSQTFWGSMTEDPLNMAPGILDADAFSFTIGSTKVNAIRWIISARGIILGTNGGIFRGTGEPITPSNIQVNNECVDGAAYNSAIYINPAVIFIQRSGKQLLSVVYHYESDGYEAEDLSILCDNLCVNGLSGLVFQGGINPVMWLYDTEGILISVTYNRLQKVIAWAHHITSGEIVSLGVIPNPTEGYDDVYAIVDRTLNATPVKTIEYLDPYLNTDCGFGSSFANPVTRLSGLEHLMGETVNVVGDGAVYPNAVVDDNGQVEIDPPASDIEVGLSYTSYLETLKPEVKSEQSTIQASKKKWAEVYVRLYQTVGVKINSEVIPFRSSTDLMDSGITPFTGDKHIVNLGWSEEGVITIEQNLPLSATVLAIFGKLEVNG